MKFGLPFFGLGPRHYARVGKAAEDHGFESVWMPEHLVFPAEMPPTYPYTETGMPPVTPDTPLFDAWVVLGGVATATERLRLATNVFILPLRHPLATARSVVTLDRLSGGRVTLGAGVGWLEEEFDQMGQYFANRGPRTDEIMGILRRLWTEDTIEHHGDFYDFGPVKFAPKTLQEPNIPIEIGGARRPPCAGPAGSVTAGSRSARTTSTTWRPRWPSFAATARRRAARSWPLSSPSGWATTSTPSVGRPTSG